MEFPFEYPVEIDGWTVAHIEGIATIRRCCVDPDDWEIECVEVFEEHLGLSPATRWRWKPSHPLDFQIEQWLYNTKAQQITEAWADREPDEKEHAA